MRARPHLTCDLPLEPHVVLERFRIALTEASCPCGGFAGRREITLHVAEDRRKRWSPWLQLAVQAHDGGTRLDGTMGPEPGLWTAFVFVYASLLVVVTAGSVYGLAQLGIGESPTGLGAAAGGLFGLACACGLDLLGRRWGQGQMAILRDFVHEVLPEAD